MPGTLERDRIRHDLEVRPPVCSWSCVRAVRTFWRVHLTTVDDAGYILEVALKSSQCFRTSLSSLCLEMSQSDKNNSFLPNDKTPSHDPQDGTAL